MNVSVKALVTVDYERFPVPKMTTILKNGGGERENVPLDLLEANAVHALAEAFLEDLYKATKLTNPWTKKSFR